MGIEGREESHALSAEHAAAGESGTISMNMLHFPVRIEKIERPSGS